MFFGSGTAESPISHRVHTTATAATAATARVQQIGPSGVRALPLAAGINEGGHYFRYFFFFSSLLLSPLFKTTEGVIVGFHIFALAPKKNNKISEKKIEFRPPPPGPLGAILCLF